MTGMEIAVFTTVAALANALIVRHVQNIKVAADRRRDEIENDITVLEQRLASVISDLSEFKLYVARNTLDSAEFKTGMNELRKEIKEIRDVLMKMAAGNRLDG